MLELLKLPLYAAGAVWRALTSERIYRLGECPYCHTSVFEDDPHVIVRGAVYHAEPCVEFAPPEEAFREHERARRLGYRLPFLP